MSALQILFVFLFCRRAAGLSAAVPASIALILHPMLVRSGAQLLPAVFSGAYIMGAFYFLSRCFEPRAGSRMTNRILVALFFFLAYLVKVPNLFFLPALAFGVWTIRRNLIDVAGFFGLLLLLFGIEWIYYIFTRGDFLGRIGAVQGALGVVQDRLALIVPPEALPLNWFKLYRYRYSPTFIGGPLVATVFYIALACAGYLVFRARRLASPRFLIGGALLCYVVVAGSAVHSLNPLVPMQTFHPRYLVVLVPVGLSAIAIVIADIATITGRRAGRQTLAWQIKMAVIIVLVTPVLWFFHEHNRESYVLSVKDHPFTHLSQYLSIVDDAAATCAPFISHDVNAEVGLMAVTRGEFQQVVGGKSFGTEPYSVGFTKSCLARYRDFGVYLSEVGARTGIDVVWATREDDSGRVYLTITQKTLPVSYLIEHFVE